MIFELPEEYYERVKPLIQGRQDINVHLLGVVNKNNRGKIFVDNIDSPKTAIVWAIGCMYFIVGDNNNEDFNNSLDKYISSVLGPESIKSCGGTHFAVTLHEDKWIRTLEEIFRSRQLYLGFENVYTFNVTKYKNLNNCLYNIPDGYSIQRINKDIIRDDVEKLITSDILGDFWISVNKFLDKGFGFCVLKGNKVVSNCFTGYVSDNFHDIVIRTYGEENKRKGFATLASRAYIEYCVSNGITPHWRTDESNKGSNAIAEKCGFELYKKCKTFCFPFN